ncbi:unnamed protein product [Euphydryas editha]|uniref:Endonuclease/exonuclease/phosphatase domain-containing protein n=1 Tax=Euphydryas editha TaxID=104508 RepID=A0AAU9V8U9_EUPED|nr:unnamed protein product [Euphydryas editha]
MSNPPSPDGVSISNSFSELPITDNAQGNYQPKEKKPSKPPPIILYGVEDVNKLTEFLETTAERSTFNYKIINKNQIRIITKDVNIYKNLISRIREKGLIGHTFNIKEERSYRLVIKNLHHTTPHNDIIDAFRETGNTVVGEIINARFGPEKKPTSTFFVNLQPGPNNKIAKKDKKYFPPICHDRRPKKKNIDSTVSKMPATNLNAITQLQDQTKNTTKTDTEKPKYYSDVVKGTPDKSFNLPSQQENYQQITYNRIEEIFIKQSEKIDMILQQMSNMMGLLTSPVNKLTNNYNIYTTNHPDGTAHGGTAVVIRSSIEHYELPQLKTEHIQATSVSVQDKNGNFNVSSVYCPPKHKITEYQFTGYIDTLGPRFIAGGDWNAKHVHWGSRLITSRGRELKKTVDKNYLTTISTSEPTHWPTDPNKLPDVLDFFIMKGLPRLFYEIGSCLDGSSNHIPVILCKSANVLTQKNPRMYNRQTNWENFRSLLTDSLELNLSLKTEDEIDNATYSFTRAVQDACWKSTEEQTHKNPRHNQVPHEIRDMILEKRR